MHVLWAEGIELQGDVFCTKAQGRVEHNDHFSYDLATSLERIKLKKDDRVEQWIEENHAWEWVDIPGKKQQKKNKFFYKVPPEIIVPYGEDDAKGGWALGMHLVQSIAKQSEEYPPNVPTLKQIATREARLAKTIFRMERVGVKIDRKYCEKARGYETERHARGAAQFKQETGRTYSASPKLFAEIFSSERAKWQFTDKGNPSFESDVLKSFGDNPAAKAILTMRDAKAKLDFYSGFLYHADKDDVIHPNLNPDGTATGRFSSSEPNLQNLTSEDSTFCKTCEEWFEEYMDTCPECTGTNIFHPEFLVRRAIIPRPGYIFIMPDWDQMEYKMMLDLGRAWLVNHFTRLDQPWKEEYFEVSKRVKEGWDVHKATAELMGVKRKTAKTLNFMLLYGGGVQKLADSLGISYDQAAELKAKYFRSLPEVNHFVMAVQQAIKMRGWIRNWAGRRYTFADRSTAYRGPNYVIQGGCADVDKEALNQIDELLLPTKSRIILNVHDEIPCEIHESEIATLPRQINEIMENVYPHKYLKLTAGMEYSYKSLADKVKGYPA